MDLSPYSDGNFEELEGNFLQYECPDWKNSSTLK